MRSGTNPSSDRNIPQKQCGAEVLRIVFVRRKARYNAPSAALNGILHCRGRLSYGKYDCSPSSCSMPFSTRGRRAILAYRLTKFYLGLKLNILLASTYGRTTVLIKRSLDEKSTHSFFIHHAFRLSEGDFFFIYVCRLWIAVWISF